MNLEEYLHDHRDSTSLTLIMEQVVNGVSELHSLGYAHRALDPTHVMLNLNPLDVRVINFTKSFPHT